MSHFTVDPQLRTLRWRLLWSSLSVIGGMLTVFGMVVYQVVSQSLEHKSQYQLKNLADAATHSFPQATARENLTHSQPRVIDNDGDLDLPWQDLQQPQQSVEWFNVEGQLLGRAGRWLAPAQSLSKAELIQDVHQSMTETDTETGELHHVTVPVYQNRSDRDSLSLQGYVRVSEPDSLIEEELARLRQGLQWGSLLALILSGAGGWWLTRQSLQPIDRSIRQLKQFTADASHELRNPLTAIKASVEVMQSHAERFHPADAAKLKAIASATDQMNQLVNDLLWLARTDRTMMPSSSEQIIPVTELLEEVIDQYLSQADQQQVALKIGPLEEAAVAGDAFQLKRLFSNLLTNALHYTPAGGRVTLSSSTAADHVIVQITDTGIGIASEHLPLIFDRFWRADASRAQQHGGSGLGLAIAQTIAYQHDGQITVHSELGQGSCFEVRLPAV